MKKGSSKLEIIMIVLIIIVLGVILYNIFQMVQQILLDSQSTKNLGPDLNYYLPTDFAVVKISPLFFVASSETNITGISISFEDSDKNIYEYLSNETILSDTPKNYVVLKNQLNPTVSNDWDFSKIRFISLKYVFGDGVLSPVIQRIEVNSEKISSAFGEKCVFSSDGGEEQVFCNN